MFWSVVFACLAAIAQFTIARMGYYLTGKSLSPRKKFMYDCLFWLFGVMGVVFVGLLAYWSGRLERGIR